MNMFSATCEVFFNIIEDATTAAQRGDAHAAYEVLISSLCQALQLQS